MVVASVDADDDEIADEAEKEHEHEDPEEHLGVHQEHVPFEASFHDSDKHHYQPHSREDKAKDFDEVDENAQVFQQVQVVGPAVFAVGEQLDACCRFVFGCGGRGLCRLVFRHHWCGGARCAAVGAEFCSVFQ